jgi:hypothetical protein
MHTNPGVYAVLVGSGISRSAKIPTGWEVVLDLTRKLTASPGAGRRQARIPMSRHDLPRSLVEPAALRRAARPKRPAGEIRVRATAKAVGEVA